MKVATRPNLKNAVTLLKQNREKWLEAAISVRLKADNPDTYSRLISVARKLAQENLPLEIKKEIAQFNKPGGSSYIYIKGLPIDPQLPPTPTDSKRPASKLTTVSEIVLLGIIARESPFTACATRGKLKPSLLPLTRSSMR